MRWRWRWDGWRWSDGRRDGEMGEEMVLDDEWDRFGRISHRHQGIDADVGLVFFKRPRQIRKHPIPSHRPSDVIPCKQAVGIDRSLEWFLDEIDAQEIGRRFDILMQDESLQSVTKKSEIFFPVNVFDVKVESIGMSQGSHQRKCVGDIKDPFVRCEVLEWEDDGHATIVEFAERCGGIALLGISDRRCKHGIQKCREIVSQKEERSAIIKSGMEYAIVPIHELVVVHADAKRCGIDPLLDVVLSPVSRYPSSCLLPSDGFVLRCSDVIDVKLMSIECGSSDGKHAARYDIHWNEIDDQSTISHQESDQTHSSIKKSRCHRSNGIDPTRNRFPLHWDLTITIVPPYSSNDTWSNDRHGEISSSFSQ